MAHVIPRAPRTETAPAGRERWRAVLAVRAGVPATATAAGIAALAAANGGYFATAWGWSALVLCWVCVVALAAGAATGLSRLEAAGLAAMAGLAGWIALSTLWSASGLESLREGQRALVYLSGLAAVLLLLRRRTVPHLLGGILGGVSAIAFYSLSTRLFPERFDTFDPVAGYRLAEPIGYWNGLGIFVVLGCLLALGFAARAQRAAVRAAASSSLVVLLPTLYFTFSRGAWIALAVGVVAAVALDARRLQLVTTLLLASAAPVAAVVLASGSGALTRQEATLGEATREGHRLAFALVLLACASAALALALAFFEKRVRVPRRGRLAYACALALVLAAGLGAVFATLGSPWALAHRASEAFKAPPPRVEGDLNARLFSFSGNGRATQWELAWADYRAHPWLGSGAGTYERYWLAHRPVAGKVRDAHSLYLETLAELGPLGLVLLGLAVGAPLLAAVRASRRGLVPAAFGAYVAYLAHAGVDWDWEMAGVTLAAVLCGAALLVGAREERTESIRLPLRLRAGLCALSIAAAGLAVAGLLGASAVSASGEAARRGDSSEAEAQARNAIRWAPWSADPWQELGRAQLAAGDLAEAQASFQAAIHKDGGDWELWLDLARAGDGEVRSRALETALRLNPLSPELAQLRSELDLEEAVQDNQPKGE